MQKSDVTQIDRLIDTSRLMLWLVLIVVSLLGLVAFTIHLFPESGWATRLLQTLPIFMIAGIVSVRKKGLRFNPDDPLLKQVREDELRVASMQRAYRNGFVSVLIAQPVLAVLLQLTQQNNIWLMCSFSLTLGCCVFITSLLILDR